METKVFRQWIVSVVRPEGTPSVEAAAAMTSILSLLVSGVVVWRSSTPRRPTEQKLSPIVHSTTTAVISEDWVS